MRRFNGLLTAILSATTVVVTAYGQDPRGAAGDAASSPGRTRPATAQPARSQPKDVQKAPANNARKGAVKRPTPPPDPKRMAELLEKWEMQSAQNHSLNVQFRRVDVSAVWDDKVNYVGIASLESPNRALLQFEKVVKGQDPRQTNAQMFELIICDGKKVYQFLYERKQIFVYPLDPSERQRALQEGPLPFLFNMKSEEATKRYEFTLLDENDAKCLIQVVPRQKIDREAFSAAFIWLDKATFMPSRLQLRDPNNGKDTKDFVFTKLVPNGEINPQSFAAEEFARRYVAKNGWKRIDNPDAQGNAAPAAAAARPKANVGRNVQPGGRAATERRR